MSEEWMEMFFPERLQYAGNGLRLSCKQELESLVFEADAFKFKAVGSTGRLLGDCSELVSIAEIAGGAAVYSGVIRHTGRRRDAYVVIVSVPSAEVSKYSGWAYKFVGDSKFGLESEDRQEIEAVIDRAGNYLVKPKN